MSVLPLATLRQAFAMVAPANLSTELPWFAQSLVITNNSQTGYLYEPTSKTFVPPGENMQAIPISSSQDISVLWQQPANVTGGPSNGDTATVTAYNVSLSPSSGTSPVVAGVVDISGGTVELAPGTAVEITGDPIISLADGTTVGISGTPTVEIEGTVNISGTVAVSDISGTVDISGAVTVTSGTVNLESGAEVIISGVPTIALEAGSAIEVSAGSVAITGGQGAGVNVLTAAPQTLLGKAIMLTGDTTVTLDVNPDENATAVLLLLRPALQVYTVEVIGANTGYVYFLETIELGDDGGNGPTAFAVPANDDNPIAIKVTSFPAVTANTEFVDVYELTAAGFTQVGNSPFAPVTVQGANLGAAIAVVGVATSPVPVIGTQGSGASVETHPQPPYGSLFTSGAGIAAGISVTILAGVAGMSIRVRKFVLVNTTAAPGIYQLQDSSGAVVIGGLNTTSVTPGLQGDGEGRVLTVGEALVIKNVFSSTGGNWDLTLNYDLS